MGAQAFLAQAEGCHSECFEGLRISLLTAMAGEQPKRVTGGAFGQYLAENRAMLQKELPGQKAKAAAKLASERFKALSDVAKAKYQSMYEDARNKYEKDLADFLSAGGVVKARKTVADNKVKKSKDPNKP